MPRGRETLPTGPFWPPRAGSYCDRYRVGACWDSHGHRSCLFYLSLGIGLLTQREALHVWRALRGGSAAAVVFIYSFMDYPDRSGGSSMWSDGRKVQEVQTAPLPGSSSLPVLCPGIPECGEGIQALWGRGTVVKLSPSGQFDPKLGSWHTLQPRDSG